MLIWLYYILKFSILATVNLPRMGKNGPLIISISSFMSLFWFVVLFCRCLYFNSYVLFYFASPFCWPITFGLVPLHRFCYHTVPLTYRLHLDHSSTCFFVPPSLPSLWNTTKHSLIFSLLLLFVVFETHHFLPLMGSNFDGSLPILKR